MSLSAAEEVARGLADVGAGRLVAYDEAIAELNAATETAGLVERHVSG